jgi:hypothetical protein
MNVSILHFQILALCGTELKHSPLAYHPTSSSELNFVVIVGIAYLVSDFNYIPQHKLTYSSQYTIVLGINN